MSYEKPIYVAGWTLVYVSIILLLLVGLFALLIYLEHNDMKRINEEFFKFDASNPSEVLEYLTLLATKPMWRIAFMSALINAMVLTAVYVYSNDINFVFFFFIILGVTFIRTLSYLSYYGFHVITPNGTQDNYLKLKYYKCKKLTR